MQFVIVTGMSGAGKSPVLKFLEDMGFFCADNLPPLLIPKFAEVCFRPGSDIERVALGLDIRGGRLFEDLFNVLNTINRDEYNYRILFLDAEDEVLLKRYKETRRNHPLAGSDRIITGIAKERELLEEVKGKADWIFDTSNMTTRQLKEKINEIFSDSVNFNSLMINVLSFGFKYGVPSDSDLVFVVRFIPNPFYIQSLKELTGNDQPVRDYVFSLPESTIFLEKTTDFLEFLIPNYVKEGKNKLVISIGCTGGRHRSVALANEIFSTLHKAGNSVVISHRDIDNDLKRR